eukprot:tig00000396_g24908.t1
MRLSTLLRLRWQAEADIAPPTSPPARRPSPLGPVVCSPAPLEDGKPGAVESRTRLLDGAPLRPGDLRRRAARKLVGRRGPCVGLRRLRPPLVAAARAGRVSAARAAAGDGLEGHRCASPCFPPPLGAPSDPSLRSPACSAAPAPAPAPASLWTAAGAPQQQQQERQQAAAAAAAARAAGELPDEPPVDPMEDSEERFAARGAAMSDGGGGGAGGGPGDVGGPRPARAPRPAPPLAPRGVLDASSAPASSAPAPRARPPQHRPAVASSSSSSSSPPPPPPPPPPTPPPPAAP